MNSEAIRAYWWNGGPGRGNFGDILTPMLCERLSGRKVLHTDVHASDLIAIGSVLEPLFSPHVSWSEYRGCIWGAGRMFGEGRLELENCSVVAVRGRLTLERIKCRQPDRVVLGDPGLLCHLFARKLPKQYKLGVIPHLAERGHPWFSQLARQSSEIVLIDICAGAQNVIDRVSQCEHVLSSALHGLVIADALRIPNRWLRWPIVDERRCGKAPLKYVDYYSAFGLTDVHPLAVTPQDDLVKILSGFGEYHRPGLEAIKQRLIDVFPFR